VASTAIINRLQANHPILTSCGCRSGLSAAMTGEYSMATVLASNGAAAVMASTAIGHACISSHGGICSSEALLIEFWKAAANTPYTLNMGEALALTKRTWDVSWSVDNYGEKIGAIFTLYGIPWVTVPYRGAQPLAAKALEPAGGAARLTAPIRVAEQSYVVEATFDASAYQVHHEDRFDYVEVAGMPLTQDTGMPLYPLAEAELSLPFDGAVTQTEVVRADPVSLGALNIPMVEPGEPIPGGDPGGPREVPADAGFFPPQPAVSRSAGLDSYRLGRVYSTPLTYDPASDQATLYRSLTVRITYVLSSTIAAHSLQADPADPGPGQAFTVRAQVLNAGDQAVQVSGKLTLQSSLGGAARGGSQPGSTTLDIPPFAVPAGTTTPLAVPWVAPAAEGPYSLLLELWQGGKQQVRMATPLTVSGGWITGLSAPATLRPGQAATLVVTFANRYPQQFSGLATFAVYTADGRPVVRPVGGAPVPLVVKAGKEGTAQVMWETAGMPAGRYAVTVDVTDALGEVPYGTAQAGLGLVQAVYLPEVLRRR
jgi:hypothetical protein